MRCSTSLKYVIVDKFKYFYLKFQGPLILPFIVKIQFTIKKSFRGNLNLKCIELTFIYKIGTILSPVESSSVGNQVFYSFKLFKFKCLIR